MLCLASKVRRFGASRIAGVPAMIITAIRSFVDGFNDKPRPQPHQPRLQEEKQLRNDLDEDKIDKMVDETFPASDPPATY